MALQSSGTIKFSEIATEFGYPVDNKFGNYRISETYGRLSNIPLDNGIPQSGQIKFSNFYNKRLNIIVDCWSNGNNPNNDRSRRQVKSHRWNTNKVNVVGGRLTKPTNTGQAGTGDNKRNKKVIIHVNKTFTSASSNNQNICALRTGTWQAGTTLQVDIGSEGIIAGAGGNGGKGADGRSDFGPVSGGGAGGNGNSALGIQYNPTTVNVLTGGQLLQGFGGGAGGRGARQVNFGADRTACGGGGGGGMGRPAGAGGAAGRRLNKGEDEVRTGSAGGGGSANSGGNGGNGGNNAGEAIGQRGGDGGQIGRAPGFATNGVSVGSGNDPGVNANPGANGAAIRKTNSGFVVTVNNNGTVAGSTSATGVA